MRPEEIERPAKLESTALPMLMSAATGDRAALEQLLQRYLLPLTLWGQLNLHLHSDQAEELAQEFVTQRILDGDLLCHFDPERGKFRHFLQRAFVNFGMTRRRKELNRQLLLERATNRGVFSHRYENSSADELSDSAWALSTIHAIVRAMREDCLAKGQAHLWETFLGRLWHPLVTGQPPLSFESLAIALQFNDLQQVRVALLTARKKFNNICRRMLLEETGDIILGQASFENLIEILSQSQPRRDLILHDLFLRREYREVGLMSPASDSRQIVALLESCSSGRPRDLSEVSKEELLETTVSDFIRHVGRDAHQERERLLPLMERHLSLFDLFVNPDASLSTLLLVKDVSRQLCDDTKPTASRQHGLCLYYLSLAAVHVNCGRIAIARASSLTMNERKKGFLWLEKQANIPALLRELVMQAKHGIAPFDNEESEY